MSDVPIGIRGEAARVLLGAYRDLKAGREMPQPRVVAAAYGEIQALLRFLESHGVADQEFDGSDLMILVNAARDARAGA
jgi:hypothetical protein